MPVSISALPPPSSSSSAAICVSFVLRSVLADRPMALSLFFKARLDRARVVVQTLEPREARDLRRERAQRPLLRPDDAHPLEKIVSTERREKPRAAARRQHVIRPRHVIAERRCRVRPDEQRTGILNFAGPALGLAQNQFDMLRRDRVRDLDRLAETAADDDGAVV